MDLVSYNVYRNIFIRQINKLITYKLNESGESNSIKSCSYQWPVSRFYSWNNTFSTKVSPSVGNRADLQSLR